MYYRINKDADLSHTSYRWRIDIDNAVYIEYNEGYIDDDWEEFSEEVIRKIAPEWFCESEETFELPTQLDRIESAVSNTLDEIRAEAVDEYTLSLMENNII